MRGEKKVLFIVGPTAAGKTSFVLDLARRVKGEIISADSMQIYKRMNVGTAKPSRLDRLKVKHHLVDEIEPTKEFSVYDFRKRAFEKIDAITKRRRLPIVTGGSGFYIKALVDGISPQPGKIEDVRARLMREADEDPAGLYERLKKADPAAAGRIHPNDKKRIVRALEIFEATGKRMTDWEKETVSISDLGYRFWIVGLDRPREELYARIEKRVDEMFRNGWVHEVKRLKKHPLSVTAREAIGYKEILEHLDGKMSLAEAKAMIKQRTRQFARRQLTWFRAEKRIRWVEAGEKSRKEIEKMVSNG